MLMGMPAGTIGITCTTGWQRSGLWEKVGSFKAASLESTALMVCPCKMTLLIVWQIVISLGREALSRALWFGKVQQTSKAQGGLRKPTPCAQGCHHHPHTGSSYREPSFRFLPTFVDGGASSHLFGPWEYYPSAPGASLFSAGSLTLCIAHVPRIGQHHSSLRFCWQV